MGRIRYKNLCLPFSCLKAGHKFTDYSPITRKDKTVDPYQPGDGSKGIYITYSPLTGFYL
jgi:hypothetical protein